MNGPDNPTFQDSTEGETSSSVKSAVGSLVSMNLEALQQVW